MVTFTNLDTDQAEENKIKNQVARRGSDDMEGGFSEKSMMPNKRTTPVQEYYVAVRTLDRKELGPYHLDANATVASVKAKVQIVLGLPPEQQRLFFEIPARSGSPFRRRPHTALKDPSSGQTAWGSLRSETASETSI